MSVPRVITRWRATITLVAWTLLAAGCGSGSQSPSFGSRIDFGQAELYYLGGVTEDQARKVGELLVREKYFADAPATVQLRYLNRRYELRCVVRAGAETDTPARAWRALGEKASRECFGGSPVDVHLCDERLNTLRTIPFEPIRPELPLAVTFRPSVGGGSLVAQYRNTSSRYLAVVVTLRNATASQSKTVMLTITPYQTTEHGWAEGWSYYSGEAIAVTHADYETLELRVP